jgi:hypothetical protein
MGAQGMNTGLQDAYNLAWKLAAVVQGKAGTALLDSYEAERLPVAKRLLQTTDRAFQLVVSDNWLAGLFRTRIMARLAARAMTIARVRNLAFRTISQIGIAYRASALSETLPGLPADAPQAGDRFPWLMLSFEAKGPEDLFRRLDDTRFNLLVFGGASSPAELAGLSALGDTLRVHVVPRAAENDRALAGAQIPQPSMYLLRPDGHVGLCGPRLAAGAVGRYLRERVGVGGTSAPADAAATSS